MPAVSALGVGSSSIMNLTVVPFGNAFYNGTASCPSGQKEYSHNGIMCWIKACDGVNPPSDCVSGSPLCQHGANECLADKIESCALKMYDLDTAVTFVGCLEGAYEDSWRSSVGAKLVMRAAQGCSGQDPALAQCYNGASGAQALANNAMRTVALGTAKTGTPYVLVNGKESDSRSLLRAVCQQYTGPKPAACRRQTAPTTCAM